MAERFITPKTSLREAINNAAGPIALSNRVLLQFAPLFVLTPLVGWIADRMDRRFVARTVLLHTSISEHTITAFERDVRRMSALIGVP